MAISLTSELNKLKTATRPNNMGNSDELLHDRWFWQNIQNIAKKESEEALKKIKSSFVHDVDIEGNVCTGQVYTCDLKIVYAKQFDKGMYQVKLYEKHNIPLHSLRELELEAKASQTRRTYKVEPR